MAYRCVTEVRRSFCRHPGQLPWSGGDVVVVQGITELVIERLVIALALLDPGVDLLLCIGCLVVSITDAKRIDTRVAVLHRFDGTNEQVSCST